MGIGWSWHSRMAISDLWRRFTAAETSQADKWKMVPLKDIGFSPDGQSLVTAKYRWVMHGLFLVAGGGPGVVLRCGGGLRDEHSSTVTAPKSIRPGAIGHRVYGTSRSGKSLYDIEPRGPGDIGDCRLSPDARLPPYHWAAREKPAAIYDASSGCRCFGRFGFDTVSAAFSPTPETRLVTTDSL